MDIKQIFKELAAFLGKKLDVLSGQNELIVSQLNKLAEKEVQVIQVKGDDGHTPTTEELTALITPLIPVMPETIEAPEGPTTEELTALITSLIPKVSDGKTPSKSELLALITPLIPKAPPAPTKKELTALITPLIPKVSDGNDGSPDTGEEIVDKINADASGKLIKKEHIEGMAELEQMARTADANARTFINTGSYVYDLDLSDSLNGVTKTFTTPSNARIIAVISSSFPTIFRKTTDYTTTNGSITFTSQIEASTTLAAGQSLIVLYKIL